MDIALLYVACFWLAWANGANDNFIGVATLYGSGTCGYRTALAWATITTMAGSLVSISFAHLLVIRFTGAGLVGEEFVGPPLLLAAASAAAMTKILATRLGMSASTTHAIFGGLAGAGFVANPLGVNWAELVGGFAKPLLLSPFVAAALTAGACLVFYRLRRWTGAERNSCLCVTPSSLQTAAVLPDGGIMLQDETAPGFSISLGKAPACKEQHAGPAFRIEARWAIDAVHYLSGGAVCFARAASDTPKIAALLLAAGASSGAWGNAANLGLVATAMAAGGWLHARRVAVTMSRRIADLNRAQGLTANLVTAALVLGASRLGLPVSTTHVACSSIFGIGLLNDERRWRTVAAIGMAWVSTLPAALAFGAAMYWFAA